MSGAAFVYSDRLSRHVLREGHPMRPVRLRYTYELLEALGAFQSSDSSVVEPRPASEEDVLTCHTGDYVDATRSLSAGLSTVDPTKYGFSAAGDNPIYSGMYDAALLSTGASLVAADRALSGEVRAAFNISGGLHHAMPSNASGFCIFNDPAIAIKAMVGRGLRVAYVDIDAHHGDGVQQMFYDTDSVLTISLHESGRYLFPGTGFVEEKGSGPGEGYSVNLPLAPYTGDDVYLWAFQQAVLPLLELFKPDALVTQLGVDTYYSDPLTHLALTSRGFVSVVESLAQAAKGVPWIALGGGGYDLSAVARCWALAYGVMTGQELPDDVPESERGRLGKDRVSDVEEPPITRDAVQATRQFAEASVRMVEETIFPHHV